MSGINVALKTAKIQIFDLNKGSLTDIIKLLPNMSFGDKVNMRVAGRIIFNLSPSKFGSFFSTLSSSGVPHSILLCSNDREEDIESEFNRIMANSKLYTPSDAFYDCHLQNYVERIQRMDLDIGVLDGLLERGDYTQNTNDFIRKHTSEYVPSDLAKKGYSVLLYSKSHKTIAKSILIGSQGYNQDIERDFNNSVGISKLYKPSLVYTRR